MLEPRSRIENTPTTTYTTQASLLPQFLSFDHSHAAGVQFHGYTVIGLFHPESVAAFRAIYT